jgi:hypothetical protein
MSPAARANHGDELSIRTWAAELEAAAVIARQLAPTAFIPESLKRFHFDEHGQPLNGKDGRAYRLDLDATTATAAAAILTGQELGLKPMASLRSIAVINNTPALAALTLRAVLQNAGHDIWVAESTQTRAVVRVRRAGDTEVQESTWTIDRARLLLGNAINADRSQWRKQSQAMLVARATAEGARWIAADAILGIPYIAEELIDELEGGTAPLAIEAPVDGDGAPDLGAATVRPKRTVSRRKTPARAAALPAGAPLPRPADEPPAVAAANARDVPPDAEPAPGKITKPQLDKLHAGLRDIGVNDRDKGLDLVSTWAGRRVDSTAKLTEVEAHAVIESIEAVRAVAARQGAEAEQDAAEQSPP